MYVCVCFSVTKEKLYEILKEHNIKKITDIKKIDLFNQCHLCKKEIKQIIKENNT